MTIPGRALAPSARRSPTDRLVELAEAGPGVGGLEGLGQVPEVEQLVAQIGALVAPPLPRTAG